MIKKITSKGSVLVFSLIIMFLILSVVLGITKVVVTQQQTSSVTSKSTQAIQIANSGLEKVLNKKKDTTNTQIQDLADKPNDCENGIISYSLLGGQVTISFFNNNNSINNCSGSVSNIKKIKSVGEINGIKRAIQVTVE